MLVDSFLMCFRQFYFLTQSDDFVKAIAFAWRQLLANNQNSVVFLNIRCFFEQLFAQNKYNMLIDSFLICFRQFYFLIQSDDFAKAIAFASRPFLAT